MKKFTKVFMLLVFFSASAPSFAQKFGVKAGLNLSTFMIKDDDQNYSDDLKLKPGFHLGATGEFPISGKFSFTTGLLFSTKGYKEKGEINFGSGTLGTYTGFANVNYLEVPLTPKVTFGSGTTKFYLTAGPYVAIALSGKAKIEVKSGGQTEKNSEKIEFGSDNGELRRLDFGLTAGAGVEIENFQIGLSYGYGLATLSNHTDNGYRVKNRLLSFSVGYRFGKNK
jgi:hypothetical protein